MAACLFVFGALRAHALSAEGWSCCVLVCCGFGGVVCVVCGSVCLFCCVLRYVVCVLLWSFLWLFVPDVWTLLLPVVGLAGCSVLRALCSLLLL